MFGMMIVYTGEPKQTDIVYPCLSVWCDDSIYRYSIPVFKCLV